MATPHYESLQQNEDDDQFPASSSASSSSAARPPLVAIQTQNEGIFSNISAKPEKQFEELEPPAYESNEAVPTYFEATVSAATVSEDGEVLIEGMEVGGAFIFIINVIVSMSFDFIGFLLTSILAMTHAARCGSRMGLGITMIRYGIMVRTRDVDEELTQYRYYDPQSTETADHLQLQNSFVSYLLMVVGVFVILHANAEYYRAARLRAVILSSEQHPAV